MSQCCFCTASTKVPSVLVTIFGEHRGKTSAHAQALEVAENLNPTFVNKTWLLKN